FYYSYSVNWHKNCLIIQLGDIYEKNSRILIINIGSTSTG
ncbi:unnamed protein product, partial [marine sediment metagenome]